MATAGVLDEKYAVYAEAISDLAAFDSDYGQEANQVGFSRFDSSVGHALADTPFDQWSLPQLAQARRILSRYRNTQLPGLGYVWSEMPDVDDLMPTRDAGTKTPGFAVVDVEADQFVLKWGGADPYFRQRIEDARSLPGARYSPEEKAWRIPVTLPSIDAVATMLAKYARTDLPFNESDSMRESVEAHINKVEEKLRASEATDVSRDELKLHRAKDAEKVRPFQLAGIKFATEMKQTIIADDMGCCDKDTMIRIRRGATSKYITIEALYRGFNNLQSQWPWSSEHETLVWCLKDGKFGFHPVRNVLDKGVKESVRVTLESGKDIVLTPDHEIAVPGGGWVPAGELVPGDVVLTNGVVACKECGSTEGVSTYKYAKFKGYCRTCVYRIKRAKPTWKGGRALDKDGYVRLSGHHDHPEANQHGQILEHRYVMEQHLGRALAQGEIIHHINGIKDDNRIENLIVTNPGEHMAIHGAEARLRGVNKKIVPKEDRVVSIDPVGERHVYDIVMDDPYRNFVANGIVVHNCGKTVQSILAACEVDAFPCLVICPASLKLNWKREINMWVKHGQDGHEPVVHIAEGTKPKGIPVLGGGIDFFIINYDILNAWKDILASYPWKAVIADEVHMAKSEKSLRTKAIKHVLKEVAPEYRFMLTGTPILNRPIEIWPVLGMIGGQRQFGGWMSFAKKYCGLSHNGFGYSANGATNLPELNTQLRSSGLMIRRRKEDVLTELPDKQWAKVPVEMYPKALAKAYVKAERDLEKFLQEMSGDNSEEVRSEALQRISTLRQLAWRGKEKATRDWIDNFLDTGKKLIVFAWHKDAVNAIADHYDAPRIMGGMKKADVEEGKRRFQEDDDCNVIVCNIAAGGVGHTLTAASDVLFLEYAWNYALMDQAVSRAHRIGQRDTVTGWMLAATLPNGEGTIDHEMIEVIENKEAIVKAAVDGDVTESVGTIQSRLQQLLQDADEWDEVEDE